MLHRYGRLILDLLVEKILSIIVKPFSQNVQCKDIGNSREYGEKQDEGGKLMSRETDLMESNFS